jgi:UDPglucose 6-dehydrogenase
MKKPNIGIVGKGFVGSAVQHGFSPNVGCDAEVRIYDKDPSRSLHSLDETINKSDFVFVSVPTPSKKNGSADLTILESVLSDIADVCTSQETIILIRSTIIPGTTRCMQLKFNTLKLVFNPEFLTERSANFDFINQSRAICGGDKKNTNKVADLFRWRFGQSFSILETNFESAELIKYMANTFFATKISFLNDMKLLSDKSNANWEDVIEGFVRDGRIGHSHLNVPGHDGRYGFGGVCFPKDIQAIIHFADTLDIDMTVLKGAWETNLKVRPEKDWEEFKGRSVSDILDDQ